jgi:hypothetical protein
VQTGFPSLAAPLERHDHDRDGHARGDYEADTERRPLQPPRGDEREPLACRARHDHPLLLLQRHDATVATASVLVTVECERLEPCGSRGR